MNKHEIESYIKAGQIASEIKKFARNLVKPGMKLIDIAIAIDDKIEEMGAETAFPVNLCIDEIAAHFTPEIGCEEVAKGLFTIDIGIAIDGYIADTAMTIDLTEDNRHKEMINLNETIMKNLFEVIKPGIEVNKIGNSVQDTVQEWNKENNTQFSTIKSLSGHQLGQHIIHAGLTVSNNRTDNKTILDNIAIAVEPFVTTGIGDIYEGNLGGIYALISEAQVRDNDSRKVIQFIKDNYKTRPFCSRWLEKAGLPRLKFILPNLVKQDILHHYPLLIEKSKAPVSQIENTFVIAEGKVRVTTI
ncbi:MAG: type II methionyl aminopeptidase [archaeon]|nr:type II methionyl aminopeptidase [archaeon]MCR4323417.1 type II methionyl aminopeptidase [Nanoarchaeota archaeon]